MKFRTLFLLLALTLAFAGTAMAQSMGSGNQTYSCTIQGLVPAAAATDVFVISGNATTTVAITKVYVSGTQTTAGNIDVFLIKRSTADTLGTSTTPTIVPHDSRNNAAVSVCTAYTANPTVGTAVGSLRVYRVGLMAASTATPTDNVYEQFGMNDQPIVLRGTAQQLAVNLNAVTVAGGALDIAIEWTEY